MLSDGATTIAKYSHVDAFRLGLDKRVKFGANRTMYSWNFMPSFMSCLSMLYSVEYVKALKRQSISQNNTFLHCNRVLTPPIIWGSKVYSITVVFLKIYPRHIWYQLLCLMTFFLFPLLLQHYSNLWLTDLCASWWVHPVTDMHKCGATLVECFTLFFTVYHNNAAEYYQEYVNRCQTSSAYEE